MKCVQWNYLAYVRCFTRVAPITEECFWVQQKCALFYHFHSLVRMRIIQGLMEKNSQRKLQSGVGGFKNLLGLLDTASPPLLACVHVCFDMYVVCLCMNILKTIKYFILEVVISYNNNQTNHKLTAPNSLYPTQSFYNSNK